MIHVPGVPAGSVPRLLKALEGRGLEFSGTEAPGTEGGATLLLWTPTDWMKLGVWLALWRAARGARIVILSRVGAHPDARAESLRDLWRLEEFARVSLIPTLVLRLAPLVGERSPFWLRLRSRPRLGAESRTVVMPVLEEDALGAVERALREARSADAWYEIVGPDARSLAEWVALAAARGEPEPSGAGAWEPELEELAEHRLAEPEIWQERFAVVARSAVAWVGQG